MAFSCDQGSNFNAMLQKRGVSKDCPYFYAPDYDDDDDNDDDEAGDYADFMDTELLSQKFSSSSGPYLHTVIEVKPKEDLKKIFVFADVPHVIKNTRNCLERNNIETSTGLAKWDVIKTFFESDKKQKLKLAPKLSNRHFRLGLFGAKMKVKYATQVLSASVAAGISTYARFGAISDADGTADFVKKMNQCFDIFNSSVRKGLAYKSALTLNSPSMDSLDTIAEWIQSWKVRSKTGADITKNFKFIDGWLMNIASVKQLMQFLHKERNFEYLCTRRLCTDPLENLFSIIRGKRGFDQNPTCLAFSQSFKNCVAN